MYKLDLFRHHYNIRLYFLLSTQYFFINNYLTIKTSKKRVNQLWLTKNHLSYVKPQVNQDGGNDPCQNNCREHFRGFQNIALIGEHCFGIENVIGQTVLNNGYLKMFCEENLFAEVAVIEFCAWLTDTQLPWLKRLSINTNTSTFQRSNYLVLINVAQSQKMAPSPTPYH